MACAVRPPRRPRRQAALAPGCRHSRRGWQTPRSARRCGPSPYRAVRGLRRGPPGFHRRRGLPGRPATSSCPAWLRGAPA
ncbi:hypothetical protein G6F63_016696 [Rhizopus arrhizus]|nr:hypothetical protein G6F63_016696 [Rhizopus arrhizus]